MQNDISKINDIELFYLMKNGDSKAKKAFAELYSRYSNRLYSYCLRFLNDKEIARDVFQEAFTRFYQSANSERAMTNVPAFLLRIARNLCVNHFRNKKNVSELYENTGISKDLPYENKELLELIHQALDELPEDYREAFMLREYEGLSYQEIAEITESSLSNVKIRIFRAKEKIRVILSPFLKDINSNL